ncbi:Crp/Fnr family transcriptional regulator [Dysgonomonas sp. BGC7]|uniref:Crp/Fnr family transcriptional regulator n=1 Tax=Dysgonomonas sp. BGC7 TaxID=1658008 RepID=UPI00068153B6|nr:Crp/Fnr family transcriptional regulator [Dysgonomonas sp. BGC7]MBD8388227.1 Crp/Fnr family transcriptional regulator [Dysgonomonas sp. BGC7]
MVNLIELTEQQIAIIRRIPLFRGISDKMRENLLCELDYFLTPLKKGEIIITQGSPCNHMHILLAGKLDVNIIDASGNNIKIEDIIAPRAFATPHLFDGNSIFPATFTVVEDGLLFRATKESAFRLISCEPEMLRNFLRMTGNCNACTVSRLRILSYKSLRSRIAFYLFDYHRQAGDTITISHNQTQLAEYLNVTRPGLAREIKSMVDEGLITISGKEVVILNIQKLMQSL